MRYLSLNLRGNRINSLCGLERLLSLEKLDIRDNEIYDAAEVVRLVTLPHLTDLWISEGNPFLDDPTSHRGHGWRLRFFDGFLRVPDKAGRRQLADLPKLDGSLPSWNEHRHLSHVHKYDEKENTQTTAVRETSTWPRNGRNSSDATVSAPVKTIRSRRSRNFSENAAQRSGAISPPPPLPTATLDRQSDDALKLPNSPSPLLSTASSHADGSTTAKVVKKKHRRVVDLDKAESQVVAERDKIAGRSHHRVQTVPTASSGSFIRDENAQQAASLRHESTLPSNPHATRKNVTSRALTPNTFQEPAMEAVKGSLTDDGSDAEDFRRKMERLRSEVGATNWLSVYANTVHTRQADGHADRA